MGGFDVLMVKIKPKSSQPISEHESEAEAASTDIFGIFTILFALMKDWKTFENVEKREKNC